MFWDYSPSVESSKKTAREILYWPKMDEDIEKFVRSCSVCNSWKTHQQQELLKIHNVPARPWSLVATDLFLWNQTLYLVLVYSYPGWFEFNKLCPQTAIRRLEEHFARFSVPDMLYSNDGPQYTSGEYR